jgi:predicted secreted protein
MFTDARGKKIVFIAHCILNQNAISDGTADFPGTDEAIVGRLLKAGVGIVQLPCPELNCLGLDRGDPEGATSPVIEENTRIRGAMGETAPARILAGLVERVVFEVEQYTKHGFNILGLVGINRSPSCGVDTTSRCNQEEPGRGVFMEALRTAFADHGLHVDMIGVKAAQKEEALKRLESLLS